MARKLSRLAWHGCGLFIAIIAGLSAQMVGAEEKVRVSSSSLVLPNPFAAPSTRQEPAPVEPEAPRRRPTTYHNPFANMPAAPPIEMPVRPGPVSRWRRPALPAQESPIKTAILSAEPQQPARPAWDQLPLEDLIATGRKESKAAAESKRPGSSIRFAPEPLTQPVWLAPPGQSQQPIEPRQQTAASEPLLQDPFESPESTDSAESSHNVATAPDIDLLQSPTASAGPSLESPVSPAAEPAPLEKVMNIPSLETPTAPPAASNVSALPLVISDYSASPEGWFAEAQQLAQTAESVEDMTAIVDLCQRALAEAPATELAGPLRRLAGWAHNRCGELQIEQGLAAEATKNFQIAIALDPNCSLAIHNRAVTLAQQNESEAALRDFNRVIELNPGLAVAYRNRAELLASLGRFNEAVLDYARAIDGLPEAAELYRARGIAHQRLGSFEEAAADFDRSLKLAPNDPDTYTQRGNLAAERGEFESAVKDLQRAIAIDANWAEAYRSLAWLHATCPNARYRDPQQAIAAAEEAAKLSPPTDCFALDALAAAHASAGNFEEAARIAQQAITSAPPDYAELLRQRLTLYQQGQPFTNAQADSVRAASHEAPTAK